MLRPDTRTNTGDAIEQGKFLGVTRYLRTGPQTPYVQDPETRVIRLTHPRVRGKAAVKAAKRARQAHR